MKEKAQILTPARKLKVQQEAIEKSLLLAALALTDFFEFDGDKIIEFWNKVDHYASIINTPEAGIKMDYICELLQKNGVQIHWRWRNGRD